MAVGVIRVGRTARQPESQQRHHGGRRIRQIVDRVGHNGHRAHQQTHNQLAQKQQAVADDSRDACQNANRRMDGGIPGILIIFHKQTKKKFGHVNSSQFQIPSDRKHPRSQYRSVLSRG